MKSQLHRRGIIAGLCAMLGLAACGSGAHAEETEKPEQPDAATASADKVHKTEAEWREMLSPMQYKVLREKGTERAFTGEYWDHKGDGVYVCAGCGQKLYDSKAKFKSGTGWPSYYEAVTPTAVATESDNSWIMSRTELLCSRCGGHLGHVFDDGPQPTGKRHCINSASLEFVPRAKVK